MTRQPSRPGYTLLELLLVMAILVLMAGIAYPTLAGMYRDVRVKAAADQVRGAWTEARANAIEDGEAYRFSVQPGTGKYRIAPDSPESWDGSNGNRDENAAPAHILEDELPSSITFEVAGGDGASGWVTVVVFNPDGGCQDDCEITLKESDGSSPVVVRVRAMTGAISVKAKLTGGT